MIEPVAVYLDPGIDHAAIERELDAQLGIAPTDPYDVRWDLVCGDVPRACQHIRITRVQLAGRACVSCDTCDHSWFEYPIVLEDA